MSGPCAQAGTSMEFPAPGPSLEYTPKCTQGWAWPEPKLEPGNPPSSHQRLDVLGPTPRPEFPPTEARVLTSPSIHTKTVAGA